MKKIKLIGKKLYRIGSLKLFKNGSTSEGSRTARSQSSTRSVGTSHPGEGAKPGGQVQVNVTRPSSRGSNRQNQLQQAEDQRRAVARKEIIAKEKKERMNKLMVDNPSSFATFIQAGDADAIAAANEQENKKVAQYKEDYKIEAKLKNLALKALPAIALDVVGLGVVNLATAIASELLSPQKKQEILNSLDEKIPGVKEIREALKAVPEEPSQKDIDAALDSGKYDNPDNPTVMEGSPRTKTAVQESRGGDKFTPPPIAGVKVAAQVVDKKVVPKTPGQMSEAELEGMLAKRARGEDSIVEKESKLARERGLAQQLSAIKGARGATAGQKLRALQRGGSKMGIGLDAETRILKAREQEGAQKALLGMKRGDRQRAEEFAKKKEFAKYQHDIGAAPGIAAAGKKQKRDQWGNILSTVKKGLPILRDIFKFEEGGKVKGPGTETSDSIPARLSDGEFVVKASAVRGLGKSLGAKDKEDQREKGVEFLYKLQDKMDKKVEKFGGGGSVDSKNEKLRKRQKLLAELKAAKIKVTIEKPKKKKLSIDDLIDMPFAKGGEIKADPERFLKFMDKGVSWSLNKKNIQKSHLPKEKKKALLEKLGEEPKFAKGGEAYVRPKKAFREAIGYEPESRFHDKAEKDAKFGGARRKFRHFKHGGEASYGDVVAAQKDLNRRLEKLEKRK